MRLFEKTSVERPFLRFPVMRDQVYSKTIIIIEIRLPWIPTPERVRAAVRRKVVSRKKPESPRSGSESPRPISRVTSKRAGPAMPVVVHHESVHTSRTR